jgi:hypothetical protein
MKALSVVPFAPLKPLLVFMEENALHCIEYQSFFSFGLALGCRFASLALALPYIS